MLLPNRHVTIANRYVSVEKTCPEKRLIIVEIDEKPLLSSQLFFNHMRKVMSS
jgi:hypothetical protein